MRTWKLFVGVLCLLGHFGLTGCASTQIQSDNPLLQANASAPHARVYFIRPVTERSMGVADNVVNIELDQRPFLKLVKGEYVLVDLKPGQVTTTIKSTTSWGPQSKVKEMSRSREFTFDDGKIYFIVISPVDGEFRGVFFLPESVDFLTAKEISKHLRAVGKAKKNPISKLDV
jgi:hypothetical protein